MTILQNRSDFVLVSVPVALVFMTIISDSAFGKNLGKVMNLTAGIVFIDRKFFRQDKTKFQTFQIGIGIESGRFIRAAGGMINSEGFFAGFRLFDDRPAERTVLEFRTEFGERTDPGDQNKRPVIICCMVF